MELFRRNLFAFGDTYMHCNINNARGLYWRLKVGVTLAIPSIIQGMRTLSYHVVAKPLLTASVGLIRRCETTKPSRNQGRSQEVLSTESKTHRVLLPRRKHETTCNWGFSTSELYHQICENLTGLTSHCGRR